jgi:hypothetical protein
MHPLAEVYLELDETDRAQELVARAISGHRVAHDCFDLMDALEVQGMIATKQGHWEAARLALDEGLALAQAMPDPYAEGRLLYAYGLLHIRQDEPEPARERLDAALVIFLRLGARKDAEQADRAIGTLWQNHASQPPATSAPDAR